MSGVERESPQTTLTCSFHIPWSTPSAFPGPRKLLWVSQIRVSTPHQGGVRRSPTFPGSLVDGRGDGCGKEGPLTHNDITSDPVRSPAPKP